MTRIKVKKHDGAVDAVDVGYSHIVVDLSFYLEDKLIEFATLTPEEAFAVASELIACAKLAKANRK
jgi:hypothetical protein